jgi:bacterioferritin-associated ferredoxin
MIVCSCNVMTDFEVQSALCRVALPTTVSQIYRHLRCEPQCGRCTRSILTMIRKNKSAEPLEVSP